MIALADSNDTRVVYYVALFRSAAIIVILEIADETEGTQIGDRYHQESAHVPHPMQLRHHLCDC